VFTIYTYIDGRYVEAVWDAERKAFVFPGVVFGR
jgi:hypothetical protein